MPAVGPRPMHVPAGLPIDEATRAEIAEVGQSNRANRNVRRVQHGAFDKRLGFAPLPLTRMDGTSRSAGRRLLELGAVIDGTDLDRYSPTAARSVVHGSVPEATVKVTGAPNMGGVIAGSIAEDCVVVNGYKVISYFVALSFDVNTFATTARHGVAVLDAQTDAVVRGLESIDSSTDLKDCRLATYGNYAIAFTCDKALHQIRVKYLDLTSVTSIAAGWQTLTTFADYFNASFDCGATLSNDRVACAFGADVGQHRVTVKTLNISGVVQTLNIVTSSTFTIESGVSISEGASTLWVSYIDGQAIKVVGLDPAAITSTALTSNTTLTTLASGQTATRIYVCAKATTGKCAVYVNTNQTAAHQEATYLLSQHVKTTTGAGGLDGFLTTTGGTRMWSRPFLRGSRIYAHFENGLLCDCTLGPTAGIPYLRPVAAPLVRDAGYVSGAFGRVRTAAVDSTRYTVPIKVFETESLAGTKLAEYDFAAPNSWRPAVVNGVTYLSGGVLSVLTSVGISEAAFVVAPEIPITDKTTGTGTDMVNGRRYVATFEQVDADGNLQTSGVSAPSDISGSQTNKALIVRVPPCAITSRGELTAAAFQTQSLHVTLWGTLDANNGQPPYYLVGSMANDPDLKLLQLQDTLDDAALAVQPQLYGTGNLPGTSSGQETAGQDHRAPTGVRSICSYNQMLVCGLGATISFSSQPIDGEGQWFSPAFSFDIDDDHTAIAAQDGSVFIFTERGVFAVAGEPPSDNGKIGGFGTPRKLACDVGSIDGVTVVTSLGIFFRSRRGIELLSRGGAVQWIGERVRQTVDAYPFLTSAVLDDVRDVVRFSLAAGMTNGVVTGEGRTLVFDLAVGQWMSTDDQRGASPNEPSQDAAMVTIGGQRRYAWLATDGTVRYEKLPTDSDAHLDGSSWVTAQYEIPPWKLGLQQEQRIYEVELLIERHSAAGITIEVSQDFGAFGAAEADFVWTATDLTDGPRHLPFRPRPRGTALGLRVRDTAPSVLGSGRGFTFVGLSADIAPIQGTTRGTPRTDTSLRR